tara:strand:+ start:1063 stop:1299 length:237 start_codon:yes stop_codon:yes gene_type:complete
MRETRDDPYSYTEKKHNFNFTWEQCEKAGKEYAEQLELKELLEHVAQDEAMFLWECEEREEVERCMELYGENNSKERK